MIKKLKLTQLKLLAILLPANLNVIIEEEIDKVLAGMPESDKKEALTTLLASSVKHNIAKKLED